jgi:citrate lyase subunit beta / citryl-CoA lyase
MSSTLRPRRACLSVPAGDPPKVAKAAALNVDEIVLDLEDAVAPSRKDRARHDMASALGGSWAARSVSVRVNAAGSPWSHLDVIACAALAPLPVTVVVPKAESAADIAFVDRLLEGAEQASGRETRIGIQALIETATGLKRLSEIASASPRLESLVLGYADLAASLGRRANNLDAWLPAQEAVLWTARSHGLQAVDGPFLGVGLDPAFHDAAARARELGFDGKWAIHPAQTDHLTDLFTPDAQEVASARRVVSALRQSTADGAGAVAVDGQMVDEAVALRARRVLAQAEELSTP